MEHKLRVKTHKHIRVINWVIDIMKKEDEPMSLHEILEALRHHEVQDHDSWKARKMKKINPRSLPTPNSLSSLLVKSGFFLKAGFGERSRMRIKPSTNIIPSQNARFAPDMGFHGVDSTSRSYQVQLWTVKG